MIKNAHFKYITLGLVGIFLVLVSVAHKHVFADGELPLLGDNAVLNINREIELGRGLYQKLKENGYVIEDPLLTRYVSDIGESLLASMDMRIRDYHFYLVKDSSVNAFATSSEEIGRAHV